MRAIALALSLIFFTSLFGGCSKDVSSIPDGTYKGTFTVNYGVYTRTGETTLELKNGRFSCYGNSSRVPAGGSGKYTSDDFKVTFFDDNFWPADFDWNLLLNGRYNYTFDGLKLTIFSNKNGVGLYQYELEKQ